MQMQQQVISSGIKEINNERLMTLTNTGRLGIGLTTPTTPLHVLGAATLVVV